MLKENNVRTGFFEREQFDLVRPPLREVRPVVHFAYLTGWRIPSEVLTLLWRQVDFEAATVARTRFHEERRRAGFPSTAELRALLEQ